MNKLSFDLKTSNDFLLKLKHDYDDFKLNPFSSRIALNCALTAWHLSEWIFCEYSFLLSKDFSNLKKFQALIKHECPSLQTMHDIANGTKHFHLNSHKAKVDSSFLNKGSFSQSFSNDFDSKSLVIVLKDGTKIRFKDEVLKCIKYWTDFLSKEKYELNQ